jgi:hypothetical protein
MFGDIPDREEGSSTSTEDGQPTADDVARILKYLDLPVPSPPVLPLEPHAFLAAHLDNLPRALLEPFAHLTTPRSRAHIPAVKSRRLLYASAGPSTSTTLSVAAATAQTPPPLLRADRGRLRWPLLWERLGGSSLSQPSDEVDEEELWVDEMFMGGHAGQSLRKLGGFLRTLEEAREAEGVREAKRVERRKEAEQGLEGALGVGGDGDADEDGMDDPGTWLAGQMGANGQQGVAGEVADQEKVKLVFERRLLELFLDGLDVSVLYSLAGHTSAIMPSKDCMTGQDVDEADNRLFPHRLCRARHERPKRQARRGRCVL